MWIFISSSNWRIFSHYFFKCYFFPFYSPSAIPKKKCVCWNTDEIPINPLKCVLFLQRFFSFCASDCLISIVLILKFSVLLPPTQIWCWIHVVNYFYSTAMLFSSSISILGPFYDINVLLISLCLYIVLPIIVGVVAIAF